MQLPFQQKEADTTDEVMAELHRRMVETDDPKTYDDLLKHYVALTQVKAGNSPRPLDINTVVNAAVSLMGIGVIVRHEQFNVITSKALGLIVKPK